MTKRTRMLVTGFGRYPGVPANPSGVLACRLARDRRLQRVGIAAEAEVFRTTYGGLDAALADALARTTPDVCVHLGLAPRSKTVRVEVLAENRARPLSPDASGRRPRRRTVLPGAPVRLRTRIRPTPVVAALRRAGVPAALSRDAGGYLCNAVYLLSLDAARSTPDRLVLFIHVPRPAPSPGHMPAARRRTGGMRRPTAEDLARALAEIALLLAAAHRHGVRRAVPPAG